jgi:hypothetical protein
MGTRVASLKQVPVLARRKNDRLVATNFAAWKAFFDHYVFRSNAHPLAHLPAHRHGVLGPLQPTNYRRIRALVMRMLRGG